MSSLHIADAAREATKHVPIAYVLPAKKAKKKAKKKLKRKQRADGASLVPRGGVDAVNTRSIELTFALVKPRLQDSIDAIARALDATAERAGVAVVDQFAIDFTEATVRALYRRRRSNGRVMYDESGIARWREVAEQRGIIALGVATVFVLRGVSSVTAVADAVKGSARARLALLAARPSGGSAPKTEAHAASPSAFPPSSLRSQYASGLLGFNGIHAPDTRAQALLELRHICAQRIAPLPPALQSGLWTWAAAMSPVSAAAKVAAAARGLPAGMAFPHALECAALGARVGARAAPSPLLTRILAAVQAQWPRLFRFTARQRSARGSRHARAVAHHDAVLALHSSSARGVPGARQDARVHFPVLDIAGVAAVCPFAGAAHAAEELVGGEMCETASSVRIALVEGCGAQALRAVATVHCAHPMCRAKQVDDGAAHGAALAEFAPFYLGREIAAGLERCYVHDAAGAEAADS